MAPHARSITVALDMRKTVPKISAYSWWNWFQRSRPTRGGPGSKDLGLLVVELSGDTQSPANRDQLLS